MERTLIERAKEVAIKTPGSVEEPIDEEIKLALAFLRGEIKSKQMTTVLGLNTTQAWQFVYRCLVFAYKTGKLVEPK
jgi:hypothetical protein